MKKLIIIISVLYIGQVTADQYYISDNAALEIYERQYHREQEKQQRIRDSYINASTRRKEAKIQQMIDDYDNR
jgi:hypothetical protein